MFFPGDPLNYPPNSLSSIRRYKSDRAPDAFDVKNFNLGDEWFDSTANDWYKLSSKSDGEAVWCSLCTFIDGDPIDFLETTDGPPPVGPNASGIINIVGGDGITTSGQGPLTQVKISMDIPVTVPNGGTGLTSIEDHAVVVGSGVAPLTELTVGTDGQALLGATGADPSFGTVTSSDNLLNFNVGAGTLDIIAQNAVASAIPLTDNAVVRGDGGGQDVQTSSMLISDAGEMTNPMQPAFFSRNNVAQNNVTGNSTVYTVQYPDPFFDNAGDYNGADTFTAPISGNYVFYATVSVVDLDATSDGMQLNIVTTLFNKHCSLVNAGNSRSGSGDTLLLNGSVFLNMDITDTCFVTIQVDGMAGDTVDLTSFAGNTFGGYLEC